MAKNKEVKEEVTIVCGNCNKHLKKVKRYYRDGKYYCGKTCWQALIKKNAKAPEAA